jgi:membrane-associated protease RseP (regulator of RpoE activity)
VGTFLGIVLFALLIGISIALHELGHLGTAKMFGMKVTRYFIGFGPKIFSFRRGETEYGLKAIPAGGFCEITGMTALDEVHPDDRPRAFYNQKTWKRVVVLSAGSITHFILGFFILYVMAATIGVPNIRDTAEVASISACVPADSASSECKPGDPAPAKDAGLREGDEIVAVNGERLATWTSITEKIRASSGPTQVTVLRDDREQTLTVDVVKAKREVRLENGTTRTEEVGVIGVLKRNLYEYNAVTAIGGAASYTGDMFANTWRGLLKFPEKIPKVVEAIGGGERDPEAPVSVVGASILGGDAVDAGLWHFFWLMLAGLNFFVGVFNLLPLLPLDGGHIAVNLYERVRNWIRGLRGLPAGAPVNYLRLLPLTYFVIFVGGAITLLTVTADIVNPIRIR